MGIGVPCFAGATGVVSGIGENPFIVASRLLASGPFRIMLSHAFSYTSENVEKPCKVAFSFWLGVTGVAGKGENPLKLASKLLLLARIATAPVRDTCPLPSTALLMGVCGAGTITVDMVAEASSGDGRLDTVATTPDGENATKLFV